MGKKVFAVVFSLVDGNRKSYKHKPLKPQNRKSLEIDVVDYGGMVVPYVVPNNDSG